MATTPVPNILPALSCITSAECNITNSVCINSQCDCPDVFPVYIGRAAGCFKGVSLTDPCTHDEECLRIEENFSACVNFKCDCVPGYVVKRHPNVGMNCVKESGRSPQVDPAMYGVLGGLGLMFIIICVVLRLFSKARFRETRSIFNTPNPRLMNASLFKDSKLLSPARTERRGSRASVRAPSRTASLASVNAAGTVNKSPNGSLTNKGRRGSVASTASGRVGTPGAPSARNHSPVPEASKDGDVTSPTKSTNKETSVAIEAVD